MSVIFSLQILWKTSLLVGKSPSPGHAMKFLSLENFQIPQTLQSSSLGAITFRGHSRALRLDPQEPLASTLHPLVLAVQGFTQYSYASHGATETNAWSQGAKGNVGPGFVRSVECDAGPLQTGGQVAPGSLESEGAKCGTPSPPKSGTRDHSPGEKWCPDSGRQNETISFVSFNSSAQKVGAIRGPGVGLLGNSGGDHR